MPYPFVGILINRLSPYHLFPEERLYRQMSIHAKSCQMQVCVFSSDDIHIERRYVDAFVYQRTKMRWKRVTMPLPSIIYDRSFPANIIQQRQHQLIRSLLKNIGSRCYGSGLKGKWQVHQALLRDPDIRPFLPETHEYKSYQTLQRWFSLHQDAFLKPQHGSQGRRTVHVQKQHGGRFHISARTQHNTAFDKFIPQEQALYSWFKQFSDGRKYVLQPYLQLKSFQGFTFDIRVLVQKNDQGQWSSTGSGVRLGQPGSITSNLHGGGSAAEAESFLTEEFGPELAQTALGQITALVCSIPPLIEQSFGRFYELGIDFGVDRQGHVWLLEVNSKPGRTIFRRLGKRKESIMSIRNPLLFARYVLDRQRECGNAVEMLPDTFRRVTR